MIDTIPTLETERLILRPFVFEDATRVQELAGDARVADTTLNVPHPYPDGAAEAWIQRHPGMARDGQAFAWAICLRQGEFVGAISMMPKIGFATNTGEIGYWLGVPYWNHGYMSESTRAVIDWGFNSLKLHRIFAEALTRNPASARVMAKAGMLFEGTARGKLIKHGKYEDMVNYAILETDRQA